MAVGSEKNYCDSDPERFLFSSFHINFKKIITLNFDSLKYISVGYLLVMCRLLNLKTDEDKQTDWSRLRQSYIKYMWENGIPVIAFLLKSQIYFLTSQMEQN